MKKFLAVTLTAAMALSLASCGSTEETTVATTAATTAAETSEETTEATDAEETTAAADDALAKSEGVMTYDEYMAADLDSEVVIEAFVQAKQSWWDDKATVYLQDPDGAYFCYNMACSEDDYALLVIGQKIKVTGYKSEWSGEIEIIDATFEVEDGSWVADPTDVTGMLGTANLIDMQNQFVSFTDMTVEATRIDGDDTEYAFLYNWDGSGSQGDDLYFTVSVDGQSYTFTVESYLCDSSTEVYQTVEGLQIGDTVDMEGFLYWYEGVNPHITSVTVK